MIRQIRPEEAAMLANALVCATIPTTDLERAKSFYGQTLGLPEGRVGVEGGVFYEAGEGTMFRVYERPAGHTTAQQTVAVFLVEDLEQEMSELRKRGVSFEEYDLPNLKTEEGVYSDSSGFKGSWVKDPDGNILGLTQILNS
jgi:catechol 2,3-dioxygenase-like lactoylglutathione lyase family enzyme